MVKSWNKRKLWSLHPSDGQLGGASLCTLRNDRERKTVRSSKQDEGKGPGIGKDLELILIGAVCPLFISWWYPRIQFSTHIAYISSINISWEQLGKANSPLLPQTSLDWGSATWIQKGWNIGKLLLFIH